MVSWTYPENDLWCEFLEHPDGVWAVWFYGATPLLQINYLDYKVGSGAIEVACWPSPYIRGSFELILSLREGRELNLTNAELFEFWARMTELNKEFSTTPGFAPQITVTLLNGIRDPELGILPTSSAWKNFQVSTKEYEHYSAKVGFVDWVVDPEFDWSKIVQIRFAFMIYQGAALPFSNPPQYFRLDGMLFHYALNVSVINIESNPYSGVPVRLDGGVEGVTPVVWVRDPPGIVEITIANEFQGWLFDHWDDGTTTPGKIIDASIPGVYKAIAFYKSSILPPPPPSPWQPGYYLRLILEKLQEIKKGSFKGF